MFEIELGSDRVTRPNIHYLLLNYKSENSYFLYRAIKILCNLVIHGFECACGYLNYTLDLLSKRKIKRQLKAKMVASLE
jgi:hypothetical protein